jgi:hypothetical protein
VTSSTDSDTPTTGTDSTRRFRDRLPDPTLLSLLGLVSIPGFFVPSLAGLQVFALCFLLGFWPLVRGLLPSGGDEDPADWIESGGTVGRFLLSMLVLQVNVFVQWQSLKQLAGQVAVLTKHRGRVPSPETFESAVEYRLPFDGEWTVATGSHRRDQSHSWGILTQRYAYDFLVTDGAGRTYRPADADEHGDASSTDAPDDPADYYCFGRPLCAPADGEVVVASDGHPDHDRIGWLDLDQRSILGNHLVIRHADAEYSLFAHLRQGSLAVAEGESVVAGQHVGDCGHSGNSTEPHLHFHLQDGEDFFTSAGLPITFADAETADGPPGKLRRQDSVAISAGQRVRHVDSASEAEAGTAVAVGEQSS